jgi:hypothetical protein
MLLIHSFGLSEEFYQYASYGMTYQVGLSGDASKL